MPEQLHLDKPLSVRWDNQQGIIAWFGGRNAKGYQSSILQIIANAADRGGCHAR